MTPLAAQFQAYVQQLTGLVLEWQAWPGSTLPGYLQQRYDPYPVTVAAQTSLAEPAEPVYALASRNWLNQARDLPVIPMPVVGTCVVELWR